MVVPRVGFIAVFCGFLSCIGVWAQEATEADPGEDDTEVLLDWALKIPLADGTVLNGTLYRPADSDGRRLPTIVPITPYISDHYHPDVPDKDVELTLYEVLADGSSIALRHTQRARFGHYFSKAD